MNWENRDTNVVKHANISKFSKLDNIGTPLGLFELFFDYAFDYALVDWLKQVVR